MNVYYIKKDGFFLTHIFKSIPIFEAEKPEPGKVYFFICRQIAEDIAAKYGAEVVEREGVYCEHNKNEY